MPCLELFKQMGENYQKEVLGVKDIFVLEAGSSLGLEGFASSNKHLFTIDNFGKSGKKEDVMKSFQFTTEQIKERIEKV